jgi:hypothetical protein
MRVRSAPSCGPSELGSFSDEEWLANPGQWSGVALKPPDCISRLY